MFNTEKEIDLILKKMTLFPWLKGFVPYLEFIKPTKKIPFVSSIEVVNPSIIIEPDGTIKTAKRVNEKTKKRF